MRWLKWLVALWPRRPVVPPPDATERQNVTHHMATIQRAAVDLAAEVRLAHDHLKVGGRFSCMRARLLDAERTAKNLVRLASRPLFRPVTESPREVMMRLLAEKGIHESDMLGMTAEELMAKLGDSGWSAKRGG